MDINGKVVVISGAGSGIGRATAVLCAKMGASLAISDISQSKIDETRKVVADLGAPVHSTTLDVGDWDAYQRYGTAVIDHFGHVDIVLNNAGVALGSFTVEEVTIERFKWLMDINFWGMVYGTKVFLPYLKQRQASTVINISSILGLGAISGNSAYCSSKFAIRGFTESLRMEAMVDFPHVNVLSVHPGGIQTNIARDANWGDKDVSQEEKDRLAAEVEKAFINTPEYAAKTIIKAVQKDKKRLLIGKDAKSMWRVIKWFPVGYTKLLYKSLVKDLEL